jgi:CBS domain containing-hemolysin-like protein
MDIFFFVIVGITTILFSMLEISFRSFSRISLAGFLEDFGKNGVHSFDLVKRYDMILNSLGGFSFLLKLGFFIFSYILLENMVKEPIQRIVILILLFLVFFNLFLYTICFHNKERLLRKLITLIPVAWIIFYPFKIILSFFIKKFPEDKINEADDLSEKELEVFFEEGTKEGVLEKEDKEMIESVIEFGDTLVKEIMTPRVDMIYVDIDTKINELITTINKAKKSRYPVISGRIDNIEGMVLAKDVFHYWKNNGKNFNIKKVLRKVFFIPETMRIFELLKEFQKLKKKFAVVSDEFGGVSGVVTMEDIIEEIVGEIHDEYDEDTEQIIQEKDYFIVKGDTDISELSNTLKIKLDEDEDYQTVAGLMSFKLGKIPRRNDTVSILGYNFKVLDIEKNRVKKVRIKKESSTG